MSFPLVSFSVPRVVAIDVRELSNKVKILNCEVIAVNQDELGVPGSFNSNLVFDDDSPPLQFNSSLLSGWPKTVFVGGAF